jgi:Flp pilus assembly protein TadG
MKRKQAGATAVEFALVLLILMMFLLTIVDFGRLLFTWNAATEATRAGARYAVVCDDTFQKPAVLARMQQMLPYINDISITWTPASCLAATCEGVTVAITDLNHNWISPIVGATVPVLAKPTFSTFLPREVMRQDPNSNAICS